MTDSQGAVMRRPLLEPPVHELPRSEGEPQARIGVANAEDWPGDRFPLCAKHFEVALSGLGHPNQSDRAGLDIELHRDAVSAFPVVETETPQNGPAVADGRSEERRVGKE